jgi:hypothetical protein
MDLATFWANFHTKHLVTLVGTNVGKKGLQTWWNGAGTAPPSGDGSDLKTKGPWDRYADPGGSVKLGPRGFKLSSAANMMTTV